MKLLASLAVLVAATIGSASATVINYDTTGSVFTVVGGVNQAPGTIGFTTPGTISSNAAVIQYFNVPAVVTTVDDAAPGSFIQLGVFQSSYFGTDTNIAIPAFTFVLHVNDTTAGTTQLVTGSYGGGGTISSNSSNISVTFSPTSFTLGTTAFTVFTPTPIVAPSSNGGASSIQAFVLGVPPPSSTPEPGTMLLMGAGLLGVGFSARKKFSTRS